MITGELVRLRSIRDSDFESTYDSLCRKEVTETFIMPEINNKEEFIPLFNKLKDLSLQKNPTIYGIEYEKQIVGIISLPVQADTFTEIGYAVNPDYQNRGIATEAAKLIIKHLFDTTIIDYIQASFFVGNTASERIMQKCGLEYSNINKDELFYLGKSHDLVYYKLERKNYHD